MPRRGGPCADCGVWVDRPRRPKHDRTCVPCGMKRQALWNKGMVDGTNPHLHTAVSAGQQAAESIRARKGPAFDAWVKARQQELTWLELEHHIALAELEDT